MADGRRLPGLPSALASPSADGRRRAYSYLYMRSAALWLLISGSDTQTFIYAVTLHRKRVRPLGPPPITWLSAQTRRRMGQCSAWSYVTVEAVSTC